MAITRSQEGVSKDLIQQWVNASYQKMGSKFPMLSDQIELHNRTILSIIETHAPSVSFSCEDLSKAERQVNGYFSLLQGEMTNENEAPLLTSEIQEYGVITRKIRKLFLAEKVLVSEKNSSLQEEQKTAENPQAAAAPDTSEISSRAVPFETIHSTLRPFLSDADGRLWVPTSKKARAAYNAKLGATRIMVADERFSEGLKYLYCDLPRGGISDWSYMKHFRAVLEALAEDMLEKLSGGCEDYALEYRQRCRQALDTLERKIRSDYELPDASPQIEPMLWKSTLMKIYDEEWRSATANFSLEESLRDFSETHAGMLFQHAYEEFNEKQNVILSKVPARIHKEHMEIFCEENSGLMSHLSELLQLHIVPHLGQEIAARLYEQYNRLFVSMKLELQQQFEWASHDPDGLAVLLEQDGSADELVEPEDGLEALRLSQPTVGRDEFMLMVMKVNQHLLRTHPDTKNNKAFERVLYAQPETFGLRWIKERAAFQASQATIFQRLPSIISMPGFRKYMNELRQKFIPLERLLQSIDKSAIKTHLQFYYDFFDAVESSVQKTFTLQFPSKGSESLTSGSILREEIERELCNANRRADAITDTAIGLSGDRVNAGFEEEIHRVVSNLPECITSIEELEGVLYWLIGRLESAFSSGTYGRDHNQISWTQEINRMQFEQALERICARLNVKGMNTKRLLSSPPMHGCPVGDKPLQRDELLQELLKEWDRAQTRVLSMNLHLKPKMMAGDVGQIMKELQANEETSNSIARLLMGEEPKVDRRNKKKNKKPKPKQKPQKPSASGPSKVDQGELRTRLSEIRDAMKRFVEEWCPEQIYTVGPIVGISSFLLEHTFQCRQLLEHMGVASQASISKVIAKIDEAHTPVLQWANHLLQLQNREGSSWPGNAASENEEHSDTLSTDVPNGFVIALERKGLEAGSLRGFLQKSCKNAEDSLPRADDQNDADVERLLRMIWEFRRIGIAIIDGHTAEGPIDTIDKYERLFGSLGDVLDSMKSQESQHIAPILNHLTECIRRGKRELEEMLCKEDSRGELKKAIEQSGKILTTNEQLTEFVVHFAQGLLAERGKLFFYSCISPVMTRDNIQKLGSLIETITGQILERLNDLITARCKGAGGLLALSELQQCFVELNDTFDLAAFDLPKNTADRFRAQVLSFLTTELGRQQTFDSLLAHYLLAELPDDPAMVIQGITRDLVQNIEDQELMGLMQRARTKYAEANELLSSLQSLPDLHSSSSIPAKAKKFLDAIHSLQESLYPDYAALARTKEPGVHSIQAIIELLYEQSQQSDDRSMRTKAGVALIQLVDTLNALRHSLSSPL